MNRIIVTGGAGFIGSAVARHIIKDTPDAVCAVDKLTCAGNQENLAPIAKSDRFKFEKVDVCDYFNLDILPVYTSALSQLKQKTGRQISLFNITQGEGI